MGTSVWFVKDVYNFEVRSVNRNVYNDLIN